ncbi:hypothetical protein CHH78_08435 [Shouchella clausii]|uniref:protein adenylyltransferase SelO n=1 Tax=Shouchella clausii TaxID=79880 RepID=UPI000BA76A2C|nr:YdiU family protein [Shouchella clausii]MBU8596939.1 YdiU family protein [Shouchella clausii]MCY1105960.1 YdiU family protein [Shouchella clausii]MEB5480529.1 YdiU family protein [Shouchella clausii]MED4157425.1 YdiU family protein [Shouchella clausii]MED4175025.1 YdiU family protein [Shouchella clausii]
MTEQAKWNFDNSYARLPQPFFARLKPNPVRSPKLVLFNEPLATALGLNGEALQQPEGVAVLAGNAIPEGGEALAQAYAGHQFGHFTMLGDGRALLIGEQITPDGKRFDIQLKGSGRTPFSRGGDGRAALGPMLREFLISEAMHALGIPTTRSLAVVTTGEEIFRETELPGAVLTRVAESHLRVGTFQYAAGRGEVSDVKTLADYAIKRHYPEITGSENPYLSLLEQVISRQAKLISQWQLVGFVHGVMNTDNMTISGETIDYGPCAFMDNYDPATVFSSIDTQGRYAYGNQPQIANWNLARFAETLVPLLAEDETKGVEIAQSAIEGFKGQYVSNWLAGMRKKLGLFNAEDGDKDFVEKLLRLMHEHEADYTNTFRLLTLGQPDKTAMHGTDEFAEWLEQWQQRQSRQAQTKDEAMKLMRTNNPAVIPRNHRVEEALAAAVDEEDDSLVKQLIAVLKEPYAYSEEQERYAEVPERCQHGYVTYCGT